MSLFFGGEKKEAILFSPMKGQLTLDGVPAAGANITLWIKWKNSEGKYFRFVSDENGFFEIPEYKDSYKESAIAQIVITQEITVEYLGEKYLIWALSKTNTHLFGELGGAPKGLKCELKSDLEPTRSNDVLIATNCQWVDIPD